jgi:hypothetical protein
LGGAVEAAPSEEGEGETKKKKVVKKSDSYNITIPAPFPDDKAKMSIADSKITPFRSAVEKT